MDEKYICPICGKRFRKLESCREHSKLYNHRGDYNNPFYEDNKTREVK